MKFRLLDAFMLLAIAALFYIQATEGRQHRSNHYFLKGQMGDMRSDLEANDAANAININIVGNSFHALNERVEKLEATK